jgi:hypothetical protein
MLTPEEDSDSRFVDPATIGCDNYDANFDKKKRRKRGATAEAAHPLGIITALVVTAGVLSCEALWKENLGFAQNLAWNSVQASSRITYQTGWRLWCSWAKEFGTTPDMRQKPRCQWQQADFPLSFEEACILAFMSMASVRMELKPGTIATYMSGVRFMLKQLRIDTTFIDSSEIIRSTKTGMEVIYRLTHPEAAGKTLPFTMDMIVYAEKHIFNAPTVHDKCIIVAMKMAYTALMRSSEYINNGKPNPHHARAEHVVCVFSYDDEFGATQRINVPSYEAHLHSEEKFLGILLDVASAKNDIAGAGNQFWWERRSQDEPPSANRPFDIALDMYRWAVMARPLKGAQFLSSSRDNGVELKYSHFNDCIKKVARILLLNDKLYSSHSLRIGGASALAAAGMPDHMIMIMGRWKSLAFMEYIRLSSKAFKETLACLGDISLFTLADARRLSDRSIVAAGI